MATAEENETYVSDYQKKLDADLVTAAKRGHLDLLDSQCKAGANINAVDEISGYSGLHFAVELDNIDMVRRILQKANLKAANLSPLNFRELTPLHIAIRRGSLQMAKEVYAREPCLIHMADNEGRTCLMLSMFYAMTIEMFYWVYSLGVDVAAINVEDKTALIWALSAAERFRAAAAYMIKDGVDVNAPLPTLSQNSPLKQAILHSDLHNVQLLMVRGAKIEFTVPIKLATFNSGIATGWKTHEAVCENLATLALRAVDVRNRDSITIADMLLRATISPPRVEAIFEFYGRVFLQSEEGQRMTVRPQFRAGHYNNLSRMKWLELIRLLCLAVASITDKITNTDNLQNKFKMEVHVFNQLVELCEDISLKRLATKAVKRKLLNEGYTNVLQASIQKKFVHLIKELISLDWADCQYDVRVMEIWGRNLL